MAERLHKIGVLGGMGPEATVLFMLRVIAATPAEDDCDHVPMLVDNNPQVPSRIGALIEGGGDDPAPVLAAMARGLEAAGAEALVMPCNTAHNYTDAIRTAVSIPFLSMVELAAQDVGRTVEPGARIGVLASPAVKATGIYDCALSALPVDVIYPQDQDAMLRAIRMLKTSASSDAAWEAVLLGARDVTARGAQWLLVGCSEFSLISERLARLYPTIDSIDVLVSHTINFAREGRHPSELLKMSA